MWNSFEEAKPAHDWRLCLAPMMDWSDRHCRYFWRLLTRRARLYTEMVTTGAILHGDRERLLRFDTAEHPLALQLGGSDPIELAQCARIAETFGFDEVNLNVGCPSDRVQSGRFGACLMADPALVAEGVAAMSAACSLPVTVKHRTGIDDLDSYELLARFVETIATAGCRTFIVHARKAWLNGLSPRENREVPPLDHSLVYQLKRDFPALTVVTNGGIDSLAAAADHLREVDGVMLGRAAYQNPWLLAAADRLLFGDDTGPQTPADVVRALLPYVERELAEGQGLCHITRHIMGLYQGVPGARRFRRHLSEHAHRAGANAGTLLAALAEIERSAQIA